MENKPTLGYWYIRGAAPYIEFTLEAAGVEYNEIRYQKPEDYYAKDRPNLPIDLPALPYYVEGDIALSETDSIMRVIAKLHKPDLLGKTLKE